MSQYGLFFLSTAWLLSILGMMAGAVAGFQQNTKFLTIAKLLSIIGPLFCVASLFALGASFVSSDFSIQYVWETSNREMPTIYKISAIWGGMDGSMLLWAAMLSVVSMVAVVKVDGLDPSVRGWFFATINSSIFFFLTVTLFLTNPFWYVDANFVPDNGNGLNPLLQNPLMIIHPPMLYAGFTTFSVPYAFCLASLFSGSLSKDWVILTRRWTLVAWGFLTAGIVLGGLWAYVELGWGGFWAWDPVENASFLPWLTGTAYLHSIMVQQKRDMLKIWNIWLIITTYALTIFGTFLTRSGIVQSVHAFADTDVGWVFLVYLGILLLTAVVGTYIRYSKLVSANRIEAIFSREAFFLLNNLGLLSICFATIWGVMFPVLSEALSGVKLTVGPPFFNMVNVPIFLLLLLLMAVGPFIAWKQASWQGFKRIFFLPVILSSMVMVILAMVGIRDLYPVIAYGLCSLVTLSIIFDFHRGIKSNVAESGRYTAAISTIVSRHRTRYGGHIIHLGVVIMVFAITSSMAFKVEKEFSVAINQTYDVGRFILKLKEFSTHTKDNYEALVATIQVLDIGGKDLITELNPEKRVYFKSQEPTTEVALYSTLREDLYLVLAGLSDDGTKAIMKVFVNPFQIWLWIGAVVIIVGTIFVVIPKTLTKTEEDFDESSN